MMATLAAAANGQTEVRRPHLVHAVRAASSDAAAPSGAALPGFATKAEPVGVAREAAEVILSGLSYSHRSGTARTACEQVFDARRCREIDWLAGKTGTPSFPGDGISLDELAHTCEPGAAKPSAGPALKKPAACTSLRPYKWYVAAYRQPNANGVAWTKAIAVLTERNWLKRSGQIHGAGDHGPTPSAEIALQIVGREVGAIAASAP